MKKILFYLLTLCLLIIASSCSKDDNETPDSPFKGEWNGVFSGDDTGSWEATISANGTIIATTFSEEFGNYTAEGKISADGDVSLTFGSVSTGATFTGTFSETSAQGKWVNNSGYDDIIGKWRGFKDGTTQADGLSNNIHLLLSDDNLNALNKLSFPVYKGYNPPNFENIYMASPFTLKATTIGNDEIGKVYGDLSIQFHNQSNTNLTVSVKEFQAGTEGIGNGSFISGTGNEFTVFTKLHTTSYNSESLLIIVCSGRLKDNGISNFHYALLMVDDYGDPNDVLIENNTGRLFYDEDRFSEVITSLKKGQLNNDTTDIGKLILNN
jgi:hypothetical protein